MVKLKTCDFVILNKERIALSETMCSLKDAERYAQERVLEELENQVKKFQKEYYDDRSFYDDIQERIKELKEVKP
jgi:hypothetical protein